MSQAITKDEIEHRVSEAAYSDAAIAFVTSKRADVIGPSPDDAARWSKFKDQVRSRELNKLRAPYYFGKSERLREIIKTAIAKIPDPQVQEFAFRHCRFFSQDPDVAGYSFSPESMYPSGNDWIVIIPILSLYLCSDAQLETVIVHEVVHGYLGHGAAYDEPEKDHAEIDSLLMRWGFDPHVTANGFSLTAAVARWEADQGNGGN